jgi:hypothetical protein
MGSRPNVAMLVEWTYLNPIFNSNSDLVQGSYQFYSHSKGLLSVLCNQFLEGRIERGAPPPTLNGV